MYFPQTLFRDLGFGVTLAKLLWEHVAICTSHPHLVPTRHRRCWTIVTQHFSSFCPTDLKGGLPGDSGGSAWLRSLKFCYVKELGNVLVTKLNSKSRKTLLEVKLLMWTLYDSPYGERLFVQFPCLISCTVQTLLNELATSIFIFLLIIQCGSMPYLPCYPKAA